MRSQRNEHDNDPEAGNQPDEGLHAREMPDESDMDEHDEPDLIPCPHCRKMIIEDAEKCHHCGQYVEDTESAGGLPLITAIVIAALVIAAVAGWMFG